MQGKNVLITGATRGLGLAVARELWQRGANLAIAARESKALRGVETTLGTRASQQLHVLAADLLDPAAPERLVTELRKRWDRLDALVNNAGMVGPVGPLWDNDWRAWQDTIQVNLLAPVNLCRLCMGWMAAGGSIVNLSGGGATSPRPNFSAYATAKAAIVRFTENLAVEAAGRRIRVNAVAPGPMNTQMLEAVLRAGSESAGGEYQKALEQKDKGGVPPENAAALVGYLVSEESRGISGRLISAVWDPWKNLTDHAEDLRSTDIYTLRRITPEDRGKDWK